MTEDVKKEFVLTKSVYKEVFMAFYKPLCLFARKILSCEEDAEDMVHNVFLAIWERKMSFIDKSHLKVYLYRAVYNQSITYIRRQKFTTRLEDHEEGNEMDENNYLQNRIETEVFVEIMQAIDRLPEHRREIFKLSYIDGLKISEVAERLGIAEETVRSQRVKARKQLQSSLKDMSLFYLLVYFRVNVK